MKIFYKIIKKGLIFPLNKDKNCYISCNKNAWAIKYNKILD